MSHYALNVSLQTVMHGFVSKCQIMPSKHVLDFDYNISPLTLFIKSNSSSNPMSALANY